MIKINKNNLIGCAVLALFMMLSLLTSVYAAAPADFPLRIYQAAFEYDGIDEVIFRAKTMNADALVLAMEGPNQGSTHFSTADFAKALNIKNNNGVPIKLVMWTDITMSHTTYVVTDMNILANRIAAVAQLEQDIINHPGIYAVELEETGHAEYSVATMNDLLTKARDAAHRQGVQLWINQPTMGPWTYDPPLAGWDVDYINNNKLVDAYLLQNGDLGDTSTGGKGTLAEVLSTQNDNQSKLPDVNVSSIAFGWSAATKKTLKCGQSGSVPECYAQSYFTMIDYFNSRGLPVTITQSVWNTSGDYYYYDTAGYGTGTVLEIMTRIPINYPSSNRASTPTFAPSAGTYTSAQSVTINTSTPDAVIHYTINGDIPTSSSPVYSIPINISTTGTIKAMAVKSGMNDSIIASGLYTIDTIAPAGNIILNPSFESGTASWSFYTNGTGSFTSSPPANTGLNSAKLSLTTIPVSPNIQLYQTNIPLEPNTQYRLTFAAYSSTGHDLTVNLLKNVSPFTSYGLSNYTPNLTSSWQVFTKDFTTSGFTGTVNDARLQIWLASHAQTGDIYYIDDVNLKKIVVSASDFNADGRVNSADLGILMNAWNSALKPKADLNQDGIVNSVDFGIMMSQWG